MSEVHLALLVFYVLGGLAFVCLNIIVTVTSEGWVVPTLYDSLKLLGMFLVWPAVVVFWIFQYFLLPARDNRR